MFKDAQRLIAITILGTLIPFSSAYATGNEQAIAAIAQHENMSINDVKTILTMGCDSGITPEMTRCGELNFMVADFELNEVFMRLNTQLKTLSAHTKLKKTQRAWIIFRDATCNFDSDGWSGGTGQSMVIWSCKEEQTKRRIDELRKYLGCTDRGCPGQE